MVNRPLTFAFAIPCFNEAQNLPTLLPALDRIKLNGQGASQLVVVSDASEDGTNEIVRRFATTASTAVRLITSEKRVGRSAAVNQSIAELRNIDVIVLISGDVLPGDDCIQLLLQEFEDPLVGVAAGRPIPCGPAGNLAFEITRLLWALHHVIASKFPKATEITAFRNVVNGLDPTSLVDEAELEVTILQKGLVIRYVPEAMILTPAPLRLTDYLKQRSRVTLGYLRLKQKRGHAMKTQNFAERLRAICVVMRREKFHVTIVLLAIGMEMIVYGSARTKFLAGCATTGTWTRSESTKRRVIRNG